MNIKSDLEKAKEKMKSNIPIWGPALAGIIGGLVIGIVSVAFGTATFIKLVVLVIGAILVIGVTFTDTKSNEEKESNISEAKTLAVIILLAMLVAEIGLFLSAKEEIITPITVIKTEKTLIERVKSDLQCEDEKEKPCQRMNVEVPYVIINYFSSSSRNPFASFEVKKSETELIDFHLSVTAYKEYFEYVPFFRYYDESEYIRKPKQ